MRLKVDNGATHHIVPDPGRVEIKSVSTKVFTVAKENQGMKAEHEGDLVAKTPKGGIFKMPEFTVVPSASKSLFSSWSAKETWSFSKPPRRQ